jgi:hypothetical protein
MQPRDMLAARAPVALDQVRALGHRPVFGAA